MLKPLALSLLATMSLLPAQIGNGEIGLLLTSNNASFGTVCTRTYSCSYIAADLVRGMPAEFVARGVLGQPWAIAIGSDQPHQCLTLPGFHNQLMSALVIVPLSGIMTEPDRILACPGGIGRATIQVPASLPAGVALTLQGLAWSYFAGGEVPTFTMAIRATVR